MRPANQTRRRFLATASLACAASRAGGPAGGRRMNRRVLLVEDQEDNRRIVRDLLASVGLDLVQAETGEDGVRQAGIHRPDLILMDIPMPVLDGCEATRRIKADRRLPASHHRGDLLRAAAYVSKPYSPRQLLAKIREHLPPDR